MIGSKGIRVFCYIIMTIAYIASVVLLILGIEAVGGRGSNSMGWTLIIAGIALPLTTTISLYPIFALSKMEDSLSDLSEEVKKISYALERQVPQNVPYAQVPPPSAYPAPPTPSAPPAPSAPNCQMPPRMPNSAPTQGNTQDAIAYLNSTYHLNLSVADDLSTLKNKIASIADANFGTLILKQKVAESVTVEQVYSVFVLHKAARASFH